MNPMSKLPVSGQTEQCFLRLVSHLRFNFESEPLKGESGDEAALDSFPLLYGSHLWSVSVSRQTFSQRED